MNTKTTFLTVSFEIKVEVLRRSSFPFSKVLAAVSPHTSFISPGLPQPEPSIFLISLLPELTTMYRVAKGSDISVDVTVTEAEFVGKGDNLLMNFPLCNCQAVSRLGITLAYRMLLIKVLEVSCSQKWSFKQNYINCVILVIN